MLWGSLILIALAVLVLAPNLLPILFEKADVQILDSSIGVFFYYHLLLWRLLAGFALLSIAFVVFMVHDTGVIFLYLASDAFSAFGRISQGAKDTLFLADLASLAYFALMTVGYLTLPVSLLRRKRQDASDA